jgi:hypothetical protein
MEFRVSKMLDHVFSKQDIHPIPMLTLASPVPVDRITIIILEAWAKSVVNCWILRYQKEKSAV